MNMKSSKLEFLILSIGLISVCVGIFLFGFLDKRGFSTGDSSYYLSLARSISQDSSFFPHGGHNSWWPPFYGILIGLVSSAGITDVIWASKILNLICFLGIGFLVIQISPKKDPLVLLGLFTASVITVAFYSYAEILFILLLCLNLLFSLKYIKEPRLLFAVLISITAFLLFFTRYIGFFILIINGIIFIWAHWKRNTTFIKLFLSLFSLIISVLAMGAYLYFNYRLTGMLTGPRYDAPETILEYMYQLIRAFGDDINLIMVFGHNNLILFIITLTIQAITIYYLFRGDSWKSLIPAKDNLPSIIFILTGLVYLITLLIIRAVTETLDLHFRYTAPGLFLLITGLLYSWVNSNNSENTIKRYLLLFLMIASILWAVGLQSYNLYSDSEYSYPEFRDRNLRIYQDVPSNTIILWGEYLINYYKSDIFVTHPHWNQRRTGETWQDFLDRLKKMYPSYSIYLQRFDPVYIDELYQHETVNEALFKLLSESDPDEWLIPVYINND